MDPQAHATNTAIMTLQSRVKTLELALCMALVGRRLAYTRLDRDAFLAERVEGYAIDHDGYGNLCVRDDRGVTVDLRLNQVEEFLL